MLLFFQYLFFPISENHIFAVILNDKRRFILYIVYSFTVSVTPLVFDSSLSVHLYNDSNISLCIVLHILPTGLQYHYIICRVIELMLSFSITITEMIPYRNKIRIFTLLSKFLLLSLKREDGFPTHYPGDTHANLSRLTANFSRLIRKSADT